MLHLRLSACASVIDIVLCCQCGLRHHGIASRSLPLSDQTDLPTGAHVVAHARKSYL
jgi:hypothetical protein